jgi:tRNA nucleotidyltransferase (CCA-adding enzyme)
VISLTVYEKTMQIRLPSKVNQIIHTLRAAGEEAYAVGGCVRDSLLGRKPADWDITTSATPEQVKVLFPKALDTGIQHGTVTVMLGGQGYEVTTYRLDGIYEDSRHPTAVTFTASLEEDLKRRDFTVNAMAYNDEAGLVDLFGGCLDLERGRIACVGEPEERFREDALRMLRGVRFCAQLGYELDPATKEGIHKLSPTLGNISQERIREELIKILLSDHPEYLRMVYETGMSNVFFPEWDTAMETFQNHPHHFYGVGEHILHALMFSENRKEIRLPILFHDIGKPAAMHIGNDGITHFWNHGALGAELTKNIMKRMKFDTATLERTVRMVRYHDYGDEEEPDAPFVRHALNKIGEDLFPDIFAVKRADIIAQSYYLREEKLDKLERFNNIYREIQQKKECVSLKDLAIHGEDLIAIGQKPGKELGETLDRLLELVLEHPEYNQKEILLRHLEST